MKIPSKIIRRPAYISRIEPFIGKSIIKVLTGQRRVGKSYLLFQLMEILREKIIGVNIIYINKEDLEFDSIRNAQELNEYVKNQSVEGVVNAIFIDEIQEIEDFEKAVRSLLLDENNDIYLTGSNANMLSGELATHLSGRYIEFTVYGLSYPEFLNFHKLEDEDESLAKYFTYGGSPYLVNLDLTDAVVFEYLKGIYSTIVYRDIVSRYNIRSTQFLERLVVYLADNIGSISSAKKISDYLKSQQTKISPNQIQAYAGYMVNAFLVHRVERYDIVGKRIFERKDKYYFGDLGIRNSIVGYRPNDAGKILENIVYNHLLYRSFDVKVGSLGSNEIDFVATKENEKLYVQVTLKLDDEKTIDREFGDLLKIEDNYPKYVVTMDDSFKNTFEGIKQLSVREFLMTI